MKRSHKYGARAVEVDGIRFPSRAEAGRYRELKLLERAGQIYGLKLQPRYKLLGYGGGNICTYVGDFEYVEPGRGLVTEDVKGFKTAEYKLKAKMFADQFRRPIVEITRRTT